MSVLHIICVLETDADGKDEHDVGFTTPAAAAAASSCSCDVRAPVSSSDVIQEVKDNEERSSVVCTGPGKQDDVVIFTRRLFT